MTAGTDIVTKLETLASNYKTSEFDFVYSDYETVCEAAIAIECLQADRDRYRVLAEYLCQNAPSMIVPNEIARLFPDPLPLGNQNNND